VARSKGTMTERSPGVWWLRVYAGRNEKGDPVQVSKTVHGGVRQARQELARLVTQVAEKGAPLSGETTVGELLDRWLEYVTPLRSPTTLRGYRTIIDRAKPVLGTVKVAKLNAQHLDHAYRDWLKDGLSPTTVHHTHVVIGTALRQAERWGLIPRAATDLASPPSIRTQPVAATDPAVVRALIAAAERDYPVLATAIALAAITGSRRGELCGLRWSDLHGSILHVRRSIKHGIDKRTLIVGPTKTHQDRKIALDTLSQAVLASHRAKCQTWAQRANVALNPDGYILSLDPSGATPMKPDTMTEGFRSLARRRGVAVRFHDLRHFSATQLIGAGVDARTVAERLGHADPSTTLRIYSSFLEERDRAAAEIIGALVAPNAQSGPVDQFVNPQG
jgi:integrase